MIRDIDKADLDNLQPNDYSGFDNLHDVFTNDGWWVYTLDNKGVKAIICFIESAKDEWATFALISKYFNARDSMEMRDFMIRVENTLKPKLLWTASLPIPSTDKWHRFLGFVFDKSIEFEGKMYNRWVIS